MLRYVNFQFATLRKKIGPYIILALSLLIIGVLAITTARAKNGDGLNSLGEISTFTKFFPFLFAVLFASFIIAHVFKEGELDGSELIVVAKPLTRMQIVLGKFILVLIYILIYQLIMFAGYILFTQSDSVASMSDKIRWSLSLFIGGLIVQIIAAAIIIMLASVLGKVGTIVVSILIAAIVPILSFTLVPLGKGWGAGTIENPNIIQQKHVVNVNAEEGKYISENSEDIYREIKNLNDFKSSYEDKRWYSAASYIDVWYHWGRFYSIFMPTAEDGTSIVKWETTETKLDDSSLIEIGGIKFAIMPSFSDITEAQSYNSVIADYVTRFSAKMQNLPANYGSATLLQRASYLVSGFDSYLTSAASPQAYEVAATIIAENKANIAHASSISSSSDLPDYIKKADAQLKVIKAKDFIPTGAVVAIWSIIGLAMCGGALWIYSRRDFK